MTDRELLELAAKAAEYDFVSHTGYDEENDEYKTHTWIRESRRLVEWDPLNDDGDALRLAVKLEMLLDLCGDETAAYCQEWCREKKENDAYATTRRAIVRAAAEVGKLK